MKYVILFSLWCLWVRRQPTLEVDIEGSKIQGTLGPNERYHQFLAIPYGYTNSSYRFQTAFPAVPWDGVYPGIHEHIRCPQRFTPSLVLGQENCLTLNVYTPLTNDRPRPVMVFFHGGGFREGSSSPFLYGADHLVDKDVVLVTVNYRIEILGFLCLGIKEAPGNTGLKDQVQALRWVRRNIVKFGGNPKSVTIFGESAGASSVLYHILSPMSKGLFHKAIMQSGSAIMPWAFQHEPLEIARKFVKQMGNSTEDVYEMYNILKNKTPSELLTTRIPRKVGDIILSETLFVPCVEKIIPGVEPFLTEDPYEILKKGNFNKVPMIIGYNSAEGLMFVGKENSTTLAQLDIVTALPRNLEFPDDKSKKKFEEHVKALYWDEDAIPNNNLTKLAMFYGDPFFKYPVLETCNLFLNHDAKVFSYCFSRDGWMNIAKSFFGFGKYPGVSHADDLFYMFKQQWMTPWMFEVDMITKLTTMWTNFAKYGDPTPTPTDLLPVRWHPTKRPDPQVFVIDGNCSTAPLWDTKTMLFWNDTYTKYRRRIKT